MFELFWAIWEIPKFIYPVAKANGKSGLKWTLYSIGIFLSVEIIILALYFFIYFQMVEKYKLPKNPGYFGLTYLVYAIALLGGLLSVQLVRRYLSRKDEVYKTIETL